MSASESKEQLLREKQNRKQLMLQDMFQNPSMQVFKSVCQPSTHGARISAAPFSSLDIHDSTSSDYAL
jgi:hypothetical protein